MPDAQGVHCESDLEPTAAMYVPGGHAAGAPAPRQYWPTGHTKHAVVSADRYVPAAHADPLVVLPGWQYSPGVHAEQSPTTNPPVPDLNVPAGDRVGVLLPIMQ